MDKFVKEAIKEGIHPSALEQMAQRDLEYKQLIFKKIAGIRMRQIISITLASILIVIMIVTMLQVFKTLDRVDTLIKAILYATGLMGETS